MKRLLVVDDDPDIRMSLGSFLEDRFEVILAEHGGDALAKLEANDIDAVILDLMMPVMDGPAFLSELAARRISIPVIVISAWGDIARRVGPATVFDTLAKPFDLESLEEVIDRAVGGGDGAGTTGADRKPGPASSPTSGSGGDAPGPSGRPAPQRKKRGGKGSSRKTDRDAHRRATRRGRVRVRSV